MKRLARIVLVVTVLVGLEAAYTAPIAAASVICARTCPMRHCDTPMPGADCCIVAPATGDEAAPATAIEMPSPRMLVAILPATAGDAGGWSALASTVPPDRVGRAGPIFLLIASLRL